MFIVADIDGSLCLSIFTNDGKQDQQDPEFQQQLLDLPALDWVQQHGIKAFQKARVVIFVTGRGIHLNNITATWITQNLGINDFRIVNVGFKSYPQYCEDKKARLAEAITECVNARASRFEPIHLIEDDSTILDYLVEIAPGFESIIIHKVKDGEHSILYPTKQGSHGCDMRSWQ